MRGSWSARLSLRWSSDRSSKSSPNSPRIALDGDVSDRDGGDDDDDDGEDEDEDEEEGAGEYAMGEDTVEEDDSDDEEVANVAPGDRTTTRRLREGRMARRARKLRRKMKATTMAREAAGLVPSKPQYRTTPSPPCTPRPKTCDISPCVANGRRRPFGRRMDYV